MTVWSRRQGEHPESRPEPLANFSPLSAEFLATVSHGPGVYQMIGNKQVLYVGKARDLRKRLVNYQMGRCLAPCAGKADHTELTRRKRKCMVASVITMLLLVKG